MATALPPPSRKEDFKDEFFSCSICTEAYDSGDHQAKCLPCQHTFCKSCLRSHAAGKGATFSCPKCRLLVTLPENTVDELPNDFKVESLKNYSDVINSVVVCGNCKSGKTAVRFCHQCGSFQCETCVESHRNMGSLQHHQLSTLAELQGPDYAQSNVTRTYRVKFIVVGAQATGKTCILNYFINNVFSTQTATTIKLEVSTKSVEIGNTILEMRIWDTAGQERFRALPTNYYRDAHGVLLVYDLTCRGTFDGELGVKKCLKDARDHNPNIVTVLCGNKNDLKRDQRQVELNEAALFAQQNGLMFLETSAKTGENVREAFLKCASAIINKIQSGKLEAELIDERNLGNHGSSVNLNQGQPQQGIFKRTFTKCC